MKKLLIGLAALLVLSIVVFVVLGATAPDPVNRPPVPADAEGGYVGGALPEGRDVAVDVAVEALPLALGYDYRSLEEGLDAATALMTEDFGAEFRTTFEQSAAQLARDEEAVTSATVRASGVVRVEEGTGDEGGRVLCLVYVDQLLVSNETTRDEDNPVQVGQQRVLVGVAQVDGEWRVDSIQPF